VLHSQVSVREDSVIGNRVILQSGVKIGGDGYGYVQKGDGTHVKIPQKGTVFIEDDVEVGANSTIDRAAMDKTIIRKGTKIDNLVQIAHSVDIGENSLIISQAGIAGSSKIGKNVIIAGQAGIPDHIKVGDNSVVAAQCGVISDLPPGSKVVGSPHMSMKDFWRSQANIRKIPELIKELKSLKKK
jgi:UDP-3-O-[3-hydroxymyristoyl] glucosamine N-acyltransferase